MSYNHVHAQRMMKHAKTFALTSSLNNAAPRIARLLGKTAHNICCHQP